MLRLSRAGFLALSLLAPAALAQPASAQESIDQLAQAVDHESPACMSCNLLTRPTLTGDWGGYRSRLEEFGITFNGRVTQVGFGVRGGISAPVPPPLTQGDRFSYTGRGSYDVLFDLEKFGWLPKGRLLVRGEHWYGDYGNISLSTGAGVPAVFEAAVPPAPDNPGALYLTDFFLVQPLARNLVVVAGKRSMLGDLDQDRFAGGNGTQQFMNLALVGNPAFLAALPYTSFIAGVVSPQRWGQIAVLVRDPENRTKDAIGLSDLYAKGLILAVEVRVKTNFFGLPGHQHVGGLWKHFDQRNLNFLLSPPPEFPDTTNSVSPTLPNAYTVYYGFDQYFVRYADDSDRGWGLFGRASFSDANPTPVQYFLSLGLGGDSPLGRNRGDSFGVGWYYIGASSEFGPVPQALFAPRNGTGVELFYNVRVTPWLNITPDIQYIKPGLGAIADEAFVFGCRVHINL